MVRIARKALQNNKRLISSLSISFPNCSSCHAYKLDLSVGSDGNIRLSQCCQFHRVMEDVNYSGDAIDISLDAHGMRLASIHTDDKLKIWQRKGREAWDVVMELRSAHQEGALSAICWAPPVLSPALLSTVGSDGILAFYRLPPAAGEADGHIVTAQTLRICHARAGLSSVAFATDGTLATLGEEHFARIYCCDPIGFANECWTLMASIDLGEYAGNGISFNPRTSRVLCAGGVVLVRGKEVWDYEVYSELDITGISCLDWGRSGLTGIGREDGAIEIWRLSGKEDKRIALLRDDDSKRPPSHVQKVKWDRSGEILASSHSDGQLRIWTRKVELEVDGTQSWPWYLRDVFSVE